ncbi:MAG: transglycosylase SLT domain-containing protein [Crocinitomicaceae bacterium]|jgi:hypothetical protein|tara:strand:- start:4320 stop:5270 length:951 start_codon:yes stop_codon:yes gene_type:complete
MKMIFLSITIILSANLLFSQDFASWENEKLWVADHNQSNLIIESGQIYEQRWDMLPQAQFWKRIMRLSKDSCLINVASSRLVLESIPSENWTRLSKSEKLNFRQKMRLKHNISEKESIYVTSGKSDFYKFEEVYPTLLEGITVFDEMCVDPWFAQAILLIESPGQLKKSTAGAYGAFQLMPSVARAQGLIVNKNTDERKDFEKSATAAAKLIRNICVPQAKKILLSHDIEIDEKELWFRFLVLHIYHAGAGNVAAVLNQIQPSVGNQSLIQSMWQNKAAGFGNCSQNYSQLAIASQLILHDLVYSNCRETTCYPSR